MFAMLFLLMALSAVAALCLIDSRIYAGFDSAPETISERAFAVVAIPALFLFIAVRLVVQKVRRKRELDEYELADFKHYLFWAFSRD